MSREPGRATLAAIQGPRQRQGGRRMLARIHALLEGPADSRAQTVTSLSVQILIVLNVLAVIASTVDPIRVRYQTFLSAFEVLSVTVFAIEYLLRLASCTRDPRYARPLSGRLRWAFTPLAIIDLLAFAPALLPLVVGLDLRMLRAVRLLRILRILKLARYSKAVQSLGRAFSSRAPELAVTGLALAIVLILASSALYYAEREVQPDHFGSIPEAAWWGIVTLTTVGYGDLAPVTPLGRFCAAIVAILGLGLFALPAGILGSAFVEQVTHGRRNCPHCGKTI